MEAWTTKILDQVSNSQVKGITDGLIKAALWVLGFGTISATIGYASIWVTIFLYFIATVLLACALYAYFYFARTNPEYLRSESHQLKMRAMELLGDKENAENPHMIHLPLITNPANKPELGEGSVKSIEE